MSSQTSLERREPGFLGVLRTVAVIAVIAGAVGSIGFMLRVGHRNSSRGLIALFTVWVLAPFVGLAWANVVAKGWAVRSRATLYGAMVVVALSSLAIYGRVALGPPRPKPAAAFLLVPAGSWLVMGMVVLMAELVRRRQSR